ncbi:hypothetical protein ACLESO_35570 [Pyxidicoccus sp. 3LG]
MRWMWMAVLAVVAGCDGIRLEDILKQHEARTRFVPEPPGDHCAHGGTAVLTGLDLDDDGELDDGEVRSTDYTCATPVPGMLVRTRPVPPGDRCPLGGQVSHAGHDTNGDGVLDDTEIVREVYGCTEAAPVLVRLTPLPPLVGFCNTEGTEVEAGPDLNRDGELDAGEVQAYARHCLNRIVVRARQRPEPAGSQCTTAGTAVLVGADSDGDGTLGDNEAHGTLYVCQPTHTFDGTYEVQSAEDLVALERITRIRGNLYIRGTELQEVVLPGLVSIEGELSIQSNANLHRVSLTGLRHVREGLDVSGNRVLDTLELGGAGERRLSVETDLEVTSNDGLRNLGGLRFVAPSRHLTVSGNAALEAIEGLDRLTALTGTLTVMGNTALTRISLPNLETVGGDLYIGDNPSLTALGGFSGLRSVEGDLTIVKNDALVDLSGMPILQTIDGVFQVDDNDALRSTEGFAQLRRVYNLAIHGNALLETAGDMPGLELIEDGFYIHHNPRLVSVRNLPALSYVGTSVGITDLPLLSSVQGLARLQRTRHLSFQNDPALTSLDELTGLREVQLLNVSFNSELTHLGLDGLMRVTARFIIMVNPKLPGCLATALADRVYTSPPGLELSIRDNATGPCPQ